MPDYRRKPVRYQAIQVGSIPHKTLAAWCGGERVREGNWIVGISVPTAYSQQGPGPWKPNSIASIGDWIVREGDHPKFAICKDEDFRQSFERIYRVDRHGRET